jgi:hypothetical protein
LELFPERLVADLERLPGAGHSFLKQVCAPDGQPIREGLERLAARQEESVARRVADLLGSLDNRRFFQGFSELSTLSVLQIGGWRARAMKQPGPRIALHHLTRPPMLLSVLAFLHQTRPGGEEETRRRLLDSLARVQSRQRFAVLVRRWLPHDFDPDPVRRAIELWLAQVHAGQWEGRYAAYEDENIALEFCLTGERARPRQSPVALTLGPFFAHRTLEVLEPKVVKELDRHMASPERNTPLLVACVADQPWAVNEGYIRDFLYGRASRISCESGRRELAFGGPPSVCAFRDPVYAAVTGVLLIDRVPADPVAVRARAWLNPWATQPLTPSDIGVRAFAEDPDATAAARKLPPLGGESGGEPVRVLRWHQDLGTRVELG